MRQRRTDIAKRQRETGKRGEREKNEGGKRGRRRRKGKGRGGGRKRGSEKGRDENVGGRSREGCCGLHFFKGQWCKIF